MRKNILIYSQYSVNSKKLIDKMNSVKLFDDVHKVCIDNRKVRKKVLKSEILKVECVPTILLLYPDGVVEKYDWSSAFEWVDFVISESMPQQQSVPSQQQSVLSQQQSNRREDEKKDTEVYMTTSINDLDENG